MSKAIFRFLRGELNGFYIQSIQNMMNALTEEDKLFFYNFSVMQFEQGQIDSHTLYNLGKFAGIYIPRVPREETRSSMRLTESEYDEQLHYEFSERGLFKTEEEDFEFVQKTLDDSGLPDINTLATSTKRSSLVGDEYVAGYIAEDETDVVDEEGNVKPTKVLPSPPENKAYSDFYSNDFLFLAEGDVSYLPISYGMFFDLFKAMQYIRYNGAVITALVRIVSILCPEGLVIIDSLEVGDDNASIVVTYTTDLTVDVDLKQDRINVLLYVINMKFPQVKMTESL